MDATSVYFTEVGASASSVRTVFDKRLFVSPFIDMAPSTAFPPPLPANPAPDPPPGRSRGPRPSGGPGRPVALELVLAVVTIATKVATGWFAARRIGIGPAGRWRI